jgi:hypothetical protein
MSPVAPQIKPHPPEKELVILIVQKDSGLTNVTFFVNTRLWTEFILRISFELKH